MPGLIENLLGLYNVQDYGGRPDGRDIVPRFYDALNALPPGGGTIVFPPGQYFLGSVATWQGRNNVTVWVTAGASFTGPGALPANAGSNRVLDLSGGVTLPSGPAGGALAGNYPAPSIAAPAAPTTQAFGDVPAAGASGFAADENHRHGMPGNGSVGTAQLAANAATQSASASGVSVGPTTTSTTFVDLPDMLITLTTSPRPGGTSDLLVWLEGVFVSSITSVIDIGVSLDGGPEANTVDITPSVANTDRRQGVSFVRFTGLAAGVHTVKGRWSNNSGTATGVSNSRQIVAVELKP